MELHRNKRGYPKMGMYPRIFGISPSQVVLLPALLPTLLPALLFERKWDILLFMRLTLAHIGSRPRSKDALDSQVRMYLERCSSYAQCAAECFRDEDAMLEWLGRQAGRTPVFAVLLDSRGRQMSSEAFAAWLAARRDQGTQHIVFAIGPAGGWSEKSRALAGLLLSFGPMTLAHSLARLVMAEQSYRAVTILTGHPYHTGH